MGERWFLNVAGIDGESAVRGFERWIEAVAYSWEVTVPSSGAGAGQARRSRATFGNLFVTAPISAASPPIVAACVTQRAFDTVVLSAVRESGDAGAPDVFLSYALEDARIVAVHHGDDAATGATERIELTYSTVRITATPQDAGGGAGRPVTTEHSVLASR